MNKQRLEQKQYQNLSPQQIQFLGLLQIPIVSLEKRIEEELEDNPTLEEDEESDNILHLIPQINLIILTFKLKTNQIV